MSENGFYLLQISQVHSEKWQKKTVNLIFFGTLYSATQLYKDL